MASVKDFSVEDKLKNLLQLQKIDSKLDEIQVLKGELPMEVSDLEDEITGLNARQTRIEEEINGISEFIEGKKSMVKDSEALIAKYEKQSENVKNNREFEAINKEIEDQQLEIKLCEKHIRDANEELTEKIKALDLAKKAVASKEGVLNHKKGELEKIIADTMVGGATLTKLLGTSAWYAPGAAGAALVESIVRDEKKLFTCCVSLNGEYGQNDICLGVPVVIGKNGWEQIVEMDLSADEQAAFNKSADAVRSMNDVLKTL